MITAERAMDEINHTVNVLAGVRQGLGERTYVLAQILELKSEILQASIEIDECCGDGTGDVCGHCLKLNDHVAHKRHQIEMYWGPRIA